MREFGPSEVDRRGYTAFQNVYVFRHLQIGDEAPACPALGEKVSFQGSAWDSFDMEGIVLAVSSCESKRLNLVVAGPEGEGVDIVGALEFLRDTLAGIEESERKRRAEVQARRERDARARVPVPNYSWELQSIQRQICVSANALGENIYRNRTVSAALLSWWQARDRDSIPIILAGILGIVLPAFAPAIAPAMRAYPASLFVASMLGVALSVFGLYRFLEGRE